MITSTSAMAALVSCRRIALVADISAASNFSKFEVIWATVSATSTEELLPPYKMNKSLQKN